MNEIEDDAGLRRAFTSLAGTAPPEAGACLDAERIYDAVRGELPPGELREVVDHLAVCPECAEAWRLAAAFEEEAGAAVPVARSRPFPRLVAVAAAALVALLAVGVWWAAFRTPEPPVWRDGRAAAIVSLLPEGEPLDRDDAVLRWELAPSGAPEGTTYDLLVMTRAFETVAEAGDLDLPRFRIPPHALEGVPPGTELQWQVEAHLPDGTRASATFRVPVQ